MQQSYDSFSLNILVIQTYLVIGSLCEQKLINFIYTVVGIHKNLNNSPSNFTFPVLISILFQNIKSKRSIS